MDNDPSTTALVAWAALMLVRFALAPVVAERLPLSEARRAHELLDSSASKGKLVLVP